LQLEKQKNMNEISITDKSYIEWIGKISDRFRKSQIKAAVKVNREALCFYWHLGRDIVAMKAEFLSALSTIGRK